MTRRLEYSATAEDDLDAIAVYIARASQSRATASAFMDRLRFTCRNLAASGGLLGTDRSELRPGLRSTPHKAYIVFFRYTDDAVQIVNILHASRDVTRFYDDG